MKILFVCTGNTCRSCMAEAIAKNMAKDIALEAEFSSAGVYAVLGEGASINSIKVMEEIGLDISNHTAKPLSRSMLDEADFVFTLTDSHRQMILSCYPDMQEKIFTILEYIGEKGDIADPFSGDIYVYRNCAAQISSSIEKLLKILKES